MIKVEIPASPAILGLILGPMAENNYRTALLKSGGDYSTFVSSPISIFFLLMIIITFITPLIKKIKTKLIK